MSALLADGIDSPVFATLAFSVIAAVLTLASLGRPASLARSLVPGLPVLFLAALAWLGQAHLALVAVLVVSALGEPLIDREAPARYLAGLGLFLAARVLYAVLFVLAADPALLASGIWRAGLIVVAAVGLGVAAKRLWARSGPLRWPMVIYGLLVLAMVAAAAMVRPAGIGIAALLLAGSDIGMAVNRFLTPTDAEPPAGRMRIVWLLRYVSQALIVFVALHLL